MSSQPSAPVADSDLRRHRLCRGAAWTLMRGQRDVATGPEDMTDRALSDAIRPWPSVLSSHRFLIPTDHLSGSMTDDVVAETAR